MFFEFVLYSLITQVHAPLFELSFKTVKVKTTFSEYGEDDKLHCIKIEFIRKFMYTFKKQSNNFNVIYMTVP